MDERVIASVFQEWKRRWDESPDEFMNIPDFVREPPKSYGEAAARYYIWLINDMGFLDAFV